MPGSMSGAVALHPLAVIPEAGPSGTSYSSRRQGGTSSPASISSGINGNGNNENSGRGSFGETTRARAHQARKRAERFMHEKAPGVSSLVAGHPHYHNNYPVNGASSDASGSAGGAGSSSASASLSVPRKRPGGASRKSRYSQSEVAHLVPDPENGDVLHDPEYEAIKIIPRRSGSSSGGAAGKMTGLSSSAGGGTTGSTSSSAMQCGSALDDDDDASSSEQSIASSTEDEQENGMEAFSPTSRRSFDHGGLRPPNQQLKSLQQRQRERDKKSSLPSRQYTHRPPGTPLSSMAYSSAAHPSAFSPPSAGMSSSQRTITALDQAYSAIAPRHASISSDLGAPSASFMKPASIQTKSSDRSSRRTYADGPATYIAPSITMRPLDVPYGEARNESYNPYTYVPTTTNPSEAYSHSRFGHNRPRHHVNFGPSTTYTYEKEETVAPPIAWQSSFTPSAEHSERHRTSQHDEPNVGANIKRSIQSIKLDISFGLMRLGKKK